MNHDIETAAAISTAAGKTGAASTGASLFGVLISNEFIALSGLLIAVISFAINMWYRRCEYQMHKSEHAARMKRLACQKCGDDEEARP